MPKFSVCVTIWDGDIGYLPHLVECLALQAVRDFEVLATIKTEYSPVVNRARSILLACRVKQTSTVVTPNDDKYGNTERRLMLEQAQGEYIMWVNADNLLYSDYLTNHLKNIQKYQTQTGESDCISVVNISNWYQKEKKCADLPIDFAKNQMDLLNYCVPTKCAREIEAFSGDRYEEDWYVFEELHKFLPIVWNKPQPVCATRF